MHPVAIAARDTAFAAYSKAEDAVDAAEAAVHTALLPLESGGAGTSGAVKEEA